MADESTTVVAEVRDSFGKGAARKIRAAGKIPAVIYEHGETPLHLTLPGHQVMLLLRRANAVLEISVEGKKQLALVKDVQRDPVRQVIEHLDLMHVRKGEKVDVEVPVHLEGEPFSGTIAMLEVATLRLEVEATNIPERVVVDIEGAEDGTQVRAGDVPLPEGAALRDEVDLLIANVVHPSVSKTDEQLEAEAAAEAEATEGDEAPAEDASESE